METKKDIRKRLRKKRLALPPEQRQQYSRKIISQVIEHPLFREADEIYCYVSCEAEVSTFELLKKCRAMGKKVAVPKVIVDNLMQFYYIDSLKSLKSGAYGIPEPEAIPELEAQGKNVLVILPGVVFDRRGNRIGYGKGFYDAYLSSHPGYHRIGLAFSAQCVELIPADSYDIRAEAVITEKGNFMIC